MSKGRWSIFQRPFFAPGTAISPSTRLRQEVTVESRGRRETRAATHLQHDSPNSRVGNLPPAPEIAHFYRTVVSHVIFTCVTHYSLVVCIFPAIGTLVVPILHCVTM